jgi:Response regulators consisting of a CheY-like receiver domain and a winged-helix DNA-binding domain
MKRRILLVDDEVAVLLTLKAVLEISGFEVDTAASAKEGRSKLHTHEYQMVITDMRMESEASGLEVIQAARAASYRPAVALLTAFPAADEDWQEMGADKMLVKPMHTRVLLEQLEKLLISHEAKLAEDAGGRKVAAKKAPAKAALKKAPVKRAAAKRLPTKKVAVKKAPAKKVAAKKAPAKKAAKKVSKKK